MRKAISAPARQIAINAGEDGSVIVGKILEKDQYNYGFDAQNGEYVDMVTKGIIDPTKVVRPALQDAASVAGLLITTEAMVAEMPKKGSAARPCRVAAAWAGWTSNLPIHRSTQDAKARAQARAFLLEHGPLPVRGPLLTQLPV